MYFTGNCGVDKGRLNPLTGLFPVELNRTLVSVFLTFLLHYCNHVTPLDSLMGNNIIKSKDICNVSDQLILEYVDSISFREISPLLDKNRESLNSIWWRASRTGVCGMLHFCYLSEVHFNLEWKVLLLS